jgi:hypothetical protein
VRIVNDKISNVGAVSVIVLNPKSSEILMPCGAKEWFIIVGFNVKAGVDDGNAIEVP